MPNNKIMAQIQQCTSGNVSRLSTTLLAQELVQHLVHSPLSIRVLRNRLHKIPHKWKHKWGYNNFDLAVNNQHRVKCFGITITGYLPPNHWGHVAKVVWRKKNVSMKSYRHAGFNFFQIIQLVLIRRQRQLIKDMVQSNLITFWFHRCQWERFKHVLNSPIAINGILKCFALAGRCPSIATVVGKIGTHGQQFDHLRENCAHSPKYREQISG